MTDPSSTAPWGSDRRPLLALIAAVLLLLFWIAAERTPGEWVWADEGTYRAMTESLARDLDLRFDERDKARIEKSQGGRTHVILQRAPDGRIAYSKPLVFPVLAAPFYAVAGARGLVLLNLLALAGALALAALHLRALARRDGADPARADWTLATWLLASALVPYLFWRMPDLLGSALCLAGLALALAPLRGLDRGLLGWRGGGGGGGGGGGAPGRAAVTAGVAGAVALASLLATGTPDPYRAERTTFLPASGYPAGEQAEEALERFDRAPAAHVKGVSEDRRQVAYAGLYYLLGRHTGLLFYFPAAVLFALALWRRVDAASLACLAAGAGSLVFFIAWKPENYFGGETFIGNRYFLPIYPLVLFLLPRLPRARLLAAIWALAAVSFGSAALSTGQAERLEATFDRPPALSLALDRGNQSHAHAGIFRLLPYESTAQSLAGRRDRYWSRHFVRFVDPFARVRPEDFELVAGLPAAELLIAHWQPPRPLRFEVRSEDAEARLEVSDWRGTRRYEVGRALGEVVGIDVETAPPWRRHAFWFESSMPYHARTIRLRLLASEGSRARLTYLGDPVENERAFAYALLGAELPSRAAPGSTDRLEIEVRNDAGVMWEREDVVAITVGVRLWPRAEAPAQTLPIQKPDERGAPILDRRYPLPARLGPGESSRLYLDVEWPRRPGLYDLEIDLVQEHVAWFQDRLGQPLARQPLELVEPRESAR